jgi:hypothetical protein
VDTVDEHVGTVTEILGKRQGLLENMAPDGHGGVRMEFRVPTRGLIGVRGLLLTATRARLAFWRLTFQVVGNSLCRGRAASARVAVRELLRLRCRAARRCPRGCSRFRADRRAFARVRAGPRKNPAACPDWPIGRRRLSTLRRSGNKHMTSVLLELVDIRRVPPRSVY